MGHSYKNFSHNLRVLFIFSFVFICSLNVFAQPANDNCSGAISLGSLPTPGNSCSGGIYNGAATTVNVNNSTATPSDPYIYQTGCAGSSSTMDVMAKDMWYSFVATGTTVNVSTSGGPAGTNIAVWTGTCGNLAGRGCAVSGNNGSASLSVTQIQPGQTYYIQVSGNASGSSGAFTMSVDNDIDCNPCLQPGATLTATPAPVNGAYLPGQVVRFCYQITQWEQQNTNWFHGVQITMGSGWTGTISNTSPANTLQNVTGPGFDGAWYFFPTGIGNANGTSWGPGFYFETAQNGTNPVNNYGDNCDGNCSWTFCWDLTVSSACSPGSNLGVTVNTSGDGESGSWTSSACTSDDASVLNAIGTCCPPTMTSTPSCATGATGTATATPVGTQGPYDYSWTNSGGTVVSTSTGIAGANTASNLAPGTYTVTITDKNNCAVSASVTVASSPAPAAPTVTSAERCGAGTLNLSAAGCTGTLNWYTASTGGISIATGTSFTTPSISATTTYYVACTVNGCEGPRTSVAATINPIPTVTTASTPVNCNGSCVGGSVTANNATGGTSPYTYNWGGGLGNGQAQSNVCPGTYTVTVTDVKLCTTTATATVSEPPVLAVTASALPTNCAGSCDGSVNANNATGGTAPYTYAWSTLGAGQSFNTACAGTFTVTATDSKNCTATTTATVTEPPVLVVVVDNTTDATCGLPNGDYTVSGSGGTPGYVFSSNGGTAQASGTFSGLTAGSYNVTIQDVNNCTATTTATVNDLSGLTASLDSQTDVSCNGLSDGDATVVSSGGALPHTYSIDGVTFGASPTFSGLSAGGITITVKDANNCTVTVAVTISEPPVLVVTVDNTTDATCGLPNGDYTVSGFGGTPTYQFSSNSGALQANGTFSGLTAGTYNVTIQDANGCEATTTATVSDLSGLTASLDTQINVSCNGLSDGSLTITSSGGGLPHQYSLNGGAYGASATFGGLTAGPYTVTVQDANTCTIDVPVTIIEPPVLVVTVDNTTDATCGLPNGDFTVSGSGGTPGYLFSSNGGTFQASGTFSGLTASTNNVTIQDANGCTATTTATVNDLSGLTASLDSKQDVSCNGLSDGSLTITSSGGAAPHTYSIDGVIFVASPTFSGLPAGGYSIVVKDANNCTVTVAVTITEPPVLIVTVDNTTDATCGLPNGDFTVSGSGGTPGYQFSTDGTTFQASGTFSGLTAGTYNVIIQDANGCTAVTSATVNDLSGLTASLDTQINVSCNGLTDGSLTITSSGGASPHQYSLNGGGFVSSPTFNNLTAGLYDITVKDANNCTIDVPVTITEPPVLVVTVDNTTDATCGLPNGAYTVSGSGGTPAYQFSSNNGTLQASGTFSNLTAGTYNVMIQDDNGCTATTTATVNDLSGLAIVLDAQTDVTCFGLSDGTATVSSTGGTLPHEYSLGSNPFAISTTFTGLPAGTYILTVRDANLCTATTSVTIAEPDVVVSSIVDQSDITCNGGNDGSVTVQGGGGIAPYQFKIDNPPVSVFQSNPVYAGLAAGSFVITIMDDNGCTVDQPVVINEPSLLTVSIIDQNDASCFGYSDGEFTVQAAGGIPAYSYTLNGITQSEGTFTGLSAGIYDVDVTDANGCIANVSITINEPPRVVVSVTPSDPEICEGNLISLTASGANTYSWSPSTGLNTVTGASVDGNPSVTTTYTVTGTNLNGCIGDTTVTVIVNPLPVITVTPIDPTICEGGSVSLTASGAPDITWSPFSYLSPGTSSPTVTVNPPSTITYTVFGTSAAGCVNSTQVTVYVTGLPVVNVTPADTAICIGESVELIGSGTVIYFDWYDANNTLFYSGPELTVSPTVTTTYNVVGTDAGGCISNTSATVNVNPLPVITIAPVDPEICFNDNVSLTASGATSYAWDANGLAGTGATINVSPSNTTLYSVTGTDANGCSNVNSTTVIVNPLPTITMTPDPSICEGETAVITAGGASTYDWTPTIAISPTTGASVAVWPSSTQQYTVFGTDINGCVNSADVTVNVNQRPTVSIAPDYVEVCIDGTRDLLASGASTYQWTPTFGLTPPNSANVTFTPFGVGPFGYDVIGTDANGCKDTASAVILVNDLPQIQIDVDTTQICFDLSVNLAGTSPNNIDTYLWSSTHNDLNQTDIQNVVGTPGLASISQYNVTYSLEVTDDKGCLNSTSKSVTVHPLPDVDAITSTPVICVDATAQLSASSTISNITYNWSELAGNPAVSSPSPSIGINSSVTLWKPGTYIYQVLGITGADCKDSTTISVLVRDSLKVTVFATPDDTICIGQSTGLDTTKVSGGDGNYTWSWSPTNGLTNVSSPNPGASPTVTTPYTLTMNDGCGTPAAQSSVTIIVNPLPVLYETPDEICLGETGILRITGADIYQWYPSGNVIGSTTSDSLVVKPVEAKDLIYSVIGIDAATGCQDTAKVVLLEVHQLPEPAFTFNPLSGSITNPIINFFDGSEGNNILMSWHWDFGGFGESSIQNPMFAFPDTGSHWVNLIVENEWNCVDSVQQLIVIKGDYAIFFPNAITVNDDKLNDIFFPKGYGFTEYELFVFDRWGEMLFSVSKKTELGWDGSFVESDGWNGIKQGFTELSQQDVYVWIFKGKSVNDETVKRAGHVTLLR